MNLFFVLSMLVLLNLILSDSGTIFLMPIKSPEHFRSGVSARHLRKTWRGGGVCLVGEWEQWKYGCLLNYMGDSFLCLHNIIDLYIYIHIGGIIIG